MDNAQEYDIYDLISRINRLEVRVDENGNEIEELRLILDKKTDENQVIVNVEEFLARREFLSKEEVKVIVNRVEEEMNHKLKQMQLNFIKWAIGAGASVLIAVGGIIQLFQ